MSQFPESFKDPCAEANKTPFAPNDRPSLEVAKTLAKCSSMDFHYGINKPDDLVEARKCAYLEMDEKEEMFFGGFSMLMMIYANGEGVDRNLDHALKFACSSDNGSYVDRIVLLKKESWNGDNFSICDQTDRWGVIHCADLDETLNEIERKVKISNFIQTWNQKDREAFKLLEKAFQSFVTDRQNNEVDCSKTGFANFTIEESATLKDDFHSDLERIENTLPQYSQKQFNTVDSKLNKTYKEIQNDTDFYHGTVSRDGIKKSQRAWLKYRDAWLNFGKIQHPNVSAESWKAWR